MSLRLSRRSALFVSGGAAALAARPSWALEAAANDDASLAEAVDAYVAKAMEAWPDQPALGVAVVRDGKTILARGYGVKRQGQDGGQAARADEHTLFAIASNTKNVTAAALAILVDEGKVKWDEPVKTYLPDFRLVDPYITDHVTVRDALSHRAGFGLGAGDLLFWPNSDRTRAEVLAQAAFVPIENGFRAEYDYCNLMFVVAGAVIEAASITVMNACISSRVVFMACSTSERHY